MTAMITELDKRLAQLRSEVPTRGMDRHPLKLKNINELSDELKSPALTELVSDKNLQCIIAYPSQIHRGWTYVPKQALLFTSTEVIHLLASIWPAQEPQITSLEGSGLFYMDVTLILLYGFLEIAAKGPNSPTRIKVEFNGVAWDLFSEPLLRLLQTTKPSQGKMVEKIPSSAAVTKALEKLPLKFSNGLKIHGLLPGEDLEGLVFQPDKWEHRFLFLRKPISANTLLILTSNFVVVIREKLGFQYGWIVTYIPRKNIEGIQNQPQGQSNVLTFQMKKGNQSVIYRLNLMNKATEEWRSLWRKNGFGWQDLPDEGVEK